MDKTDLQKTIQTVLPLYKIYTSPPDNTKLIYPCVIISLDNILNRQANNKSYTTIPVYAVSVINKNDFEMDIRNIIEKIPMSSIERIFKSDGLYQATLTIYL